MIELDRLATEGRNDATLHIDEMSALDMMKAIHAEDEKALRAVEAILPDIARAVEEIAGRLRGGGRLLYCGAGTSGRLGVLDAAECPPTFGTPPELVVGLIAGGREAMFRAREGAEDDESRGAADLAAHGLSPEDAVVGLSASGRTPYVVGALRFAREIGAFRIAVASSPGSPIAALSDIALEAETGPEAVTGSTRMKAGTAQKLILNMLSTGAMIRLGKVYGNLMVDVMATNEKLAERARRIVMAATGRTRAECIAALEEADGSAKLAILLLLRGLPKEEARRRLDDAEGYLARALAGPKGDAPQDTDESQGG